MGHTLMESEERLKLVLQATGLGYFDWNLTTGKLHWDEKMCELHGLAPNAAVDKIEYLYSITHPEDRQGMPNRLTDVPQSEHEHELAYFSRSYRISLSAQVRYIQVAGSFFQDQTGAVQRVIGSAQDITVKKKEEEQLVYQAALLENVSEAVISTDQNFVIKSWNRAAEQLYGWKAGEVIGESIFIIPTDYLKLDKAKVLDAFQNQGNWKGEVIQENRHGDSFYVLASVATIQDRSGKATGFIAINRDITREKEAERQKLRARQLELKNKELEQFAYAASHDLQEPLLTIKGFVDLLRKRIGGDLDERSTEYLDLMTQSILRMNKLIRALLEYSRVGLQEEMTLVDTHVLVRELMTDLAGPIREARAEIELEDLPSIRAYQTELRVLFQNLLSNAMKFRRESVIPHIKISVREFSDQWEFCVADNGIGISPNHQARIFAIFQRLHPNSEYPGTGIGLSQCRKIVELHGGRIWVESRPGHGSRFYFTLGRVEGKV